jgi:AbrB family looped-hinge helix DNA binding protein
MFFDFLDTFNVTDPRDSLVSCFIYFPQYGGDKMNDIKIAKITSNDSTELIYIPKSIREALNLRKGTYVVLKVKGRKLIVEPLSLKEGDNHGG